MRQEYPITSVALAEGLRSGLLIAGDETANRVTFLYEPELCTSLPLEAYLFGSGTLTITREGKTRWLVGCCSPDASALR